MLGQAYFERRLGDIFDLSPIPYLAGTGELSDGTAPLPVQWELNVSATGEPVLAFSSKKVIGPERMAKGGRFVEWRLTGQTEGGEYAVTTEGAILSRLSFASNEEYATYFGHFTLMDLRRAGANTPTKFLTDQGKPPAQESNVQQKLNQMNAYLRFIPKEMLDDTLRKDIRNPLFHQGAIVGTGRDILWDWWTSYFDLLIQIVFVVLGYGGSYISQVNHQPTPVPKPAAKK